MATGTFKWYGKGLEAIVNNDINWGADGTADKIYVALMKSSYTPNQDTHDFYDDLSAGTNEVTTGSGYSAGGKSVGTTTVVYDATSQRVRLKIDASTVWSNSTITDAKVVVLYKKNGGAASADPLIGYAVLDANTSSSSGDFTLDYDDTDGVLYIDCT